MSRRIFFVTAAGFVLGLAYILQQGVNPMSWFNHQGADLRRLLGSTAADWSEGARIAMWQPDANYKPQCYYILREVDEAGFRRMAAVAGLTVAPAPAVVEAVWRLPAGVQLDGWSDTAPVGALQARGMVGAAAVWLRWSAGWVSIVVEQASP
jgi:hypothetical protein